jgi:hypothetical protein
MLKVRIVAKKRPSVLSRARPKGGWMRRLVFGRLEGLDGPLEGKV